MYFLVEHTRCLMHFDDQKLKARKRPADMAVSRPDYRASMVIIEGGCQTQVELTQQRSAIDRLQVRACLQCCRSRLLMG